METLLVISHDEKLGESLAKGLSPEGTEGVHIFEIKDIAPTIITRETQNRVFAVIIEASPDIREIVTEIEEVEAFIKRVIKKVMVFRQTTTTETNSKTSQSSTKELGIDLSLGIPITPIAVRNWLAKFTKTRPTDTIETGLTDNGNA